MKLTKAARRTASRLVPEGVKVRVRAALKGLARGSLIDPSTLLKIGLFNGFEVAYRRGTADESVLDNSFDRDTIFAEVPEYQLSPADVIVDIGAHIGTFALLAASKVSDGAVYAIEACQDTYNLLRINAALNGMGNLYSHHLALADRNGACTLYHDAGNWGHSVVRPFSEDSETVECRTLQQFFADAGIETCSFMKLNCEGAEFPILLASPPGVLRRIGAMLVRYHCDLWSGNTEEDLIAHLRAAGFECKVRRRTGKRGAIVAVNSAWPSCPPARDADAVEAC
jgi:FkbM family methyltransferase